MQAEAAWMKGGGQWEKVGCVPAVRLRAVRATLEQPLDRFSDQHDADHSAGCNAERGMQLVSIELADAHEGLP